MALHETCLRETLETKTKFYALGRLQYGLKTERFSVLHVTAGNSVFWDDLPPFLEVKGRQRDDQYQDTFRTSSRSRMYAKSSILQKCALLLNTILH